MNAPTKTETILGCFQINPGLKFVDFGLTKSFFKSQNERLVFGELKKGNHDPVIICENLKLKSRDIATFINKITDGMHKSYPSPERVRMLITEVEKERLNAQALKKINDGAKQGIYNHESIRKIYEKIDRLEGDSFEDEENPTITVEELSALQIPEIDWLVKPIVERFGYTLIGAQKGVGKSLFVTQLGLYTASGTSPFLAEGITISKPLRVLLIQQEISLPGMKDRLFKMRSQKVFSLHERFRQKTTTGNWWNLTRRKDYEKLVSLIEKYEPDILILDPLYTFYPKELNTSGDISQMMQVLSDLKSNFNLGLIVVHHFSNKEDPDAQRASVGRFMGHSMIANSADVTIGLDFLHPKYRQQSLPLPFQNYVMVEITTRHGEWPARFALERKQGCLLFEKSSIWQDLGRSVIPGQIEDLIEAHDGEMLQKDIIQALMNEAKPTTIKKALYEAEKRGTIAKQILSGKGNPVLWRTS